MGEFASPWMPNKLEKAKFQGDMANKKSKEQLDEEERTKKKAMLDKIAVDRAFGEPRENQAPSKEFEN